MAMLGRVPQILFYAAAVGLAVLLVEHMLDAVKKPLRARTGL